MIALNATDKSLEVVLGGAVTTNELEITVHAVDLDSSDQSVSEVINENFLTNGTTPVEVLAAPAAGHVRVVKSMTVLNTDTVAAQIIVQINDGGTPFRLTRPTIDPDETLTYDGND